MGVFTRIFGEDGVEIQIKCGSDMCESYNLGDTVDWHVNKRVAGEGYLLDDVYHGYRCDDSDSYSWVVIKDHVVHAILPEDAGHYNELRKRFDIREMPASAWPKEAWDRLRQFEEKHIEEQKAIGFEVEQKYAEADPLIKAVAGHALAMARNRRRMYDAVKDMFKIQPLPSPSHLIFLETPDDNMEQRQGSRDGNATRIQSEGAGNGNRSGSKRRQGGSSGKRGKRGNGRGKKSQK